jgi:hypothetical protein
LRSGNRGQSREAGKCQVGTFGLRRLPAFVALEPAPRVAIHAMPPTQPDTTAIFPPPSLAAALARVLLGFLLLIAAAVALAWLGG